MRIRPDPHTVSEDIRQLTLFPCATLPVQSAPAETEIIQRYFLSIRRESRPPLLLACGSRDDDIALSDRQLPLPLAPQPSPFVRIVPHHRRPCLDYGVYDTFHDVPNASKAALKLENHHILLIGQLVQLSEAQVRDLVDEGSFHAIEKELIFLGLGFGTRIPFWNRKFRSLLAATR